MLGGIVDHVAPLAQSREVARAVVGWIMVEVRAGDIDPRDADDRREITIRRAHPASAPIAPVPAIGVPPSAVAQVEHPCTVRTPAMLAAPFGAAKADQPRQLGPVDRI